MHLITSIQFPCQSIEQGQNLPFFHLKWLSGSNIPRRQDSIWKSKTNLRDDHHWPFSYYQLHQHNNKRNEDLNSENPVIPVPAVRNQISLRGCIHPSVGVTFPRLLLAMSVGSSVKKTSLFGIYRVFCSTASVHMFYKPLPTRRRLG